MMSSAVRKEDIRFLEFALSRVAMAAGASEVHASYIAQAIGFAHLQGKLNQGLGVYEVLDLSIKSGILDMTSTPEVVDEDAAWAVVDGNRSSGYYTLNVMADIAIEKAKTSGIALVFGGNHNDAGSFASYVYKAWQHDMMAFSSNNTPPLVAPFGGRRNMLSCPPFDSIAPSGNEPPIWASLKFAEFYDADISEAVLQNKPMQGKWCIDPETGETTDDPTAYARPYPGYGRVWGYSCGGQIESPRTYALNLWTEALTAIINPLGVTANQISDTDDYQRALTEGADVTATVGGSYYICIDPAVFGPIAAVKARSDEFISAIKATETRPGQRIRIPGETAFKNLEKGENLVDVLVNNWEPFFDYIAGQYGLSEEILKSEFAALADPQ
jgi:L-2-hydroxycarboxylate dehydrogenase (NAD+)